MSYCIVSHCVLVFGFKVPRVLFAPPSGPETSVFSETTVTPLPHTANRNIQLKARFSPRCPLLLRSLQVFVFVTGIKSRGILNLSPNLERETGALKHHGATRTCSKQSTHFSLQGLALRRIAWQVFVSCWIHTPDLLQVVRLQKQTAHLLWVDLGVFNGSLLALCFCKRWQPGCTQGNTTWSHLAATDKWLQLGVTWFDNL